VTRPALLAPSVVGEWLEVHAPWRLEDGHLVRELATTDYPSSVRILDGQVELAERLDHHPIVTLDYCHLRFELWTHDRGGLTRLDLDYAEGLDAIVEKVGAVPS
jgi:4a-hydroxytetrahydrobiopterin dehydratase